MYARPQAKDGSPVKFQVSGRLWRDTLIFFDIETESLWSQLLGRAVQGEREGDELAHVPSARMSWSEWKALHPRTKALAKPAELERSHYQRYFDSEEKLGISGRPLSDTRLPGKQAVLGLGAGESAVAVALREGSRDVSHVEVAGERICVVRDGERATAWGASIPGGLRWSADGRLLMSKRGHGRWNPWTGEALSLDTEALDSRPSVLTYWFTWSRYHPGTAVRDR